LNSLIVAQIVLLAILSLAENLDSERMWTLFRRRLYQKIKIRENVASIKPEHQIRNVRQDA